MSLIKTHKLAKLCLKSNPILFTAIRNHWNKDYKPVPFPKSAEERAASAAKYGLLPQEYEPYPEDGAGLGDYPKLPDISGESKDPFYPWDNPELKRNFNEVMHADCDLMGEDRYDVSFKHRIPMWMVFAQFCGVFFGAMAVYYWLERCRMFIGHLPKQYPLQGKKHYTYELED